MFGGRNGLGSNDNVIWVPEDNWSIISADTDIWEGELPYKTGMQFPTPEIVDRATVSNTNRLIYNNNVDDIYNNIISVFPEIDPMYGWQIREIITKLPYFKNATNAWVGLVAGDTPLVDTNQDMDVQLSELLENSNFAETIQNEVRSRFIDIISAYRVDVDMTGKPVIVAIEPKNLICFVNKQMPTSIEVNVVFSIYKDKLGDEFIDFVEYHFDGLIRKHTFHYENGHIGEYAMDVQEDHAFGGRFNSSPVVVFKHNVINNEIYGTDQYRYWSPSMLAGMRELQNVLRLGERTREMIRKVPNSAIKKNPVDGSSVFYNRGTIGYNDGNATSPDVQYVVPEIRMEEAVKALDAAIKQIGMDTQLGITFFNLEFLGSRLSADSIKAAMFPAKLEAQRMTTEMKPSVKELIVKLGYLADLDINASKLSVEFYDGFPKDELNDIRAIQMRLESSRPSITLEAAIMKLDRVPLRIARQKAQEIRAESPNFSDDPAVDGLPGKKLPDDNVKNTLVSYDLNPTAGHSEADTVSDFVDDTVWDNQMTTKPRDLPQGVLKGVTREWLLRKLRQKDL